MCRVRLRGRVRVREIGEEKVIDDVRKRVGVAGRRGERRALGKREEVCV